ncbi:hypothetical protein ACYX8G_19290 [Microbacterium saperdae]
MRGKTLSSVGGSFIGTAVAAMIAWLSTPLRSELWFLLVTCALALVGITVFAIGWFQLVAEGKLAAARKSRENKVRRLELDGELLKVRGDIATNEHWLENAESYNDPIRAAVRRGNLGELRGREARLLLSIDALDGD